MQKIKVKLSLNFQFDKETRNTSAYFDEMMVETAASMSFSAGETFGHAVSLRISGSPSLGQICEIEGSTKKKEQVMRT